MNVYGTEQICNVVLLGHGDAGETAVTETPALLAGVTKHMDKMPDGNTINDYDKEEIKRQFSVSTTLVLPEYEGEDGSIKINLLDMPEFSDSVGEVEEVVSAVDTAIIVVNCKAGIELGTKRAWEICGKYNLPRLIFIINMDSGHASYRELMVKLEIKSGHKIIPFRLPIREDEKFVGFVNVVKMGGRRFTNLSNYEECKVPNYVQKNLTIAGDVLIEAVAEISEEYMERYFLREEFTQEEISIALGTHVIEGGIVSAMMGSDINCQGFKVLLQTIDKYFPSPDRFECIGVDVSTGEHFTAKYDDDVPLSARVFRTTVDPFIGKYSLMEICIGALRDDTVMHDVNKNMEKKTGKLYILRGKNQTEVQELKISDVGTAAKLTVTQTGDTMAVHTVPTVYHEPQTSTPYTYMAYKTASEGEDDRISTALAEMVEGDLTSKVVNDAENRQALPYDTGDQQLDVVINKLQSRYRVDVISNPPKFTFRETLRKKVKVQGKCKKQPGGHGQYGDVITEFEPSGDLETPYVSKEKIFSGSVPRNYFPVIEKGLQECVLKGLLAGYPVVGLKAILLDGSYHPVDSLEMAFKMVIILAFKWSLMETSPVLLEPIASLKVTIPDKLTGDVMGDLNRRRGHVLGMNFNHNGKQIIETDIPMPELFGYSTDLRSTIGGLGGYSYEFSHYGQTPGDVQKREVEARAAARDGE